VPQDLRSSNGTFVNGKKVGSAKLEAGDEVVFADQKYTVVQAGVKAAPKAAAAPARGSMFVRAKSASPPPARGSQRSQSVQGRGSMFGRAPARGSQSASPVRGSQSASPKRGSMFSFGGQPDLSDARAKQAVCSTSSPLPPFRVRDERFGIEDNHASMCFITTHPCALVLKITTHPYRSVCALPRVTHSANTLLDLECGTERDTKHGGVQEAKKAAAAQAAAEKKKAAERAAAERAAQAEAKKAAAAQAAEAKKQAAAKAAAERAAQAEAKKAQQAAERERQNAAKAQVRRSSPCLVYSVGTW
jgi:flagellar biosynthesis GTPase FlhF